jgi:uncharacterized repeat protein (TIGR01451 family)
MVGNSFAATPPNTIIGNTVSAFMGSPSVLAGQAKTDFVVSANIPSEIEFLSLPTGGVAADDTTELFYTRASCSPNGNLVGPFTASTLTIFDGSAVGTNSSLDFLPNPLAYSAGDPVFVKVTDFDQNIDGFAAETVSVIVSNKTNGDSEVILLTETGLSTGEFIGGIQTLEGDASSGNCFIDIGRDNELNVRYVDGDNNVDAVSADALIDPFGVFFDSLTGDPIDGVEITLIDASTDLPAQVFSPNGIDVWPSTVISGQDVVDSGGRVFEIEAGEYRFPLVFSGFYYYQIEPFSGYIFPSEKDNEQLQLLPNAPYLLALGSRGENFEVPPGPDVQIDIPFDPQRGSVYIQKNASTDSAAIGDFIAYNLSVTNEEVFPLADLIINDKLPQGFRLQEESLRINGEATTDYHIADNGRDFFISYERMDIEETFTIDYVVEITSGAEVGEDAINYAQSISDNIDSNIASAEVLVTNDLFNDVSFLIGRVYEGSCEKDAERVGVSGAKIYLEDGRSVITGSDGRWHFAGLEPGVHVLRLDEESMDEGYEILACDESSRNYGSPNSTFVDLQEGMLWRQNFVVKRNAEIVKQDTVLEDVILDRNFVDVGSMPNYDETYVESSGFQVMWPPENYTPRFRVLKVAVQHKTSDSTQLILNGQPVSGLNRRDSYVNPIFLSKITTWVGLDLQHGSNTLEIKHLDHRGKVVTTETRFVHYSGAPYRARYLPENSQLKANGRTPIIIAVELTDEDGFPVRAGTTGSFRVNSPYQAWLPENLRLENDVLKGATNESKYVVRENGVAYFPLDATTQTGRVLLDIPLVNSREEQIEAWLQAATRDWILVGLAEGTTGYETVENNLQGFENSEKESYDDGRVSFFGKGRIPGEFLLTMAYDSAAKSSDNPNELLGDVQPDEYYSVYGDESLFQDEAESSRKLYLKIERNQFYALFGDYQTNLTVTELSQYSRTLNGIKSEYKDEYFETNVFAAETSLANVRDELEGKGITGPYFLSRRDVVRNSEQIEVEVRDRFQSGRILSTTPMSHGNDYDIDYDLGVIRFRQPVEVRDQLLNPLFIVVNYETQDDREAALVAGGRGEISTADDRVEFGVSYITEENKGSESELGGVDLKIDITEDIELRSEYATSDNTSVKGADAWTVRVEQNSGQLTSSVFATEIEAGFGVGQQNASEESTRKIGADTTWRFAEKYELAATIDTQEQLIGGATDSQVGVNARRIGNKTALQVGYRIAESEDGAGIKEKSELVDIAASYQILPSLRLDASSEFSINDKDNADLYPARNTVGAEWKITDYASLFATQEITSGSDDSESTKLGMRTSLWDGADMNVGVDQRRTDELTQISAVAGFIQRAQLTENLTMDLVFDQGRDLSSDTVEANDDFKAGSLGLDWRFDSWTWNNQIETRRSENNILRGARTGLLHQLEDGRSMVGSFDWASVEGELVETTNRTFSVGYADRRSNNYAILNRLDVTWEDRDGLLSDLRERKVVSNNAFNLTAWDDGQLSLAYSAKYVISNVNDLEFSGVTDFFGVHYRHNLGKQWDVGVQTSIMRSQNSNNQQYSYGLSVGFSPVRDLWLELGYNFDGFSDDDFDAARRSTAGTYFSIRLKFDEGTAGRVKQAFAPTLNDLQQTGAESPVQQVGYLSAPSERSGGLAATEAVNSTVSIVDDTMKVVGKAAVVDTVPVATSDNIAVIILSDLPSTVAICDEQTQSRRFIQLATYSDSVLARAQLANFNILDSYLEQYQKPDNGKMLYRLVLGPYKETKAELQPLVEKYEKIVGSPSWIKNKTCQEMEG